MTPCPTCGCIPKIEGVLGDHEQTLTIIWVKVTQPTGGNVEDHAAYHRRQLHEILVWVDRVQGVQGVQGPPLEEDAHLFA